VLRNMAANNPLRLARLNGGIYYYCNARGKIILVNTARRDWLKTKRGRVRRSYISRYRRRGPRGRWDSRNRKSGRGWSGKNKIAFDFVSIKPRHKLFIKSHARTFLDPGRNIEPVRRRLPSRLKYFNNNWRQ